jgi:integrase
VLSEPVSFAACSSTSGKLDRPRASRISEKTSPPSPVATSCQGETHVVVYAGRPILKIRRGWDRIRQDAGLGPDVVPHILKHTAITWAVQAGGRLEDLAPYFSTTVETVERTYWHHHPDDQQSALDAVQKRRR